MIAITTSNSMSVQAFRAFARSPEDITGAPSTNSDINMGEVTRSFGFSENTRVNGQCLINVLPCGFREADVYVRRNNERTFGWLCRGPVGAASRAAPEAPA